MSRRLLFIGAYPPPFGGIASHLNSILPLIASQGFEISVLSPGNNNVSKTTDNISIRYFTTKSFFWSNVSSILVAALTNLRYKFDLDWILFLKSVVLAVNYKKQIEKNQIDHLFVYSIDHSFFIPLLNNLMKRPISIHLMIFGAFHLNPNYYCSRRRYINSILKNCTSILSSSQYCADSVKKILKLDFDIDINYVGIEDHLFDTSQIKNSDFLKRFNIDENAIVILYFARMTEVMGLQFIIDIHQRILEINSKIIIMIAGAFGDLSLSAKMLSEENQRIKYCVNIPFSEIAEFYRNCDMVIAPTLEKHACMGVTIKEAMACRKPIIATNSGGIMEAIEDGEQGYIVPIIDGDIDESIFIEKLTTLCSNTELIADMGEKGRERALKLFTNKATVEKYLEIIK
jgi:glycosyltransferase involved in cell wall biosynthesis